MQDSMGHLDMQDSGPVHQKELMVLEMLGYKGREGSCFPSLFLLKGNKNENDKKLKLKNLKMTKSCQFFFLTSLSLTALKTQGENWWEWEGIVLR